MHGGWAATLLGSAMGGAVLAVLGAGNLLTHVELKVLDADGRLYAHATTTCLILSDQPDR